MQKQENMKLKDLSEDTWKGEGLGVGCWPVPNPSWRVNKLGDSDISLSIAQSLAKRLCNSGTYFRTLDYFVTISGNNSLVVASTKIQAIHSWQL